MNEYNDDRRGAEIVTNVGAVRARIAAACAAVGRDPQEVTLVAITKTRPARDVVTLARIGILDIGENKDQEARAKIEELAALPTPPQGLRWHMVGQLQSNKARSVATWADSVHSVDRPKVARALDRAAGELREQPLDVFVQVNLDDAPGRAQDGAEAGPGRGGVAVGDLPALADTVAGLPALRLCGLMAVPPPDADPRACFARLRGLA